MNILMIVWLTLILTLLVTAMTEAKIRIDENNYEIEDI